MPAALAHFVALAVAAGLPRPGRRLVSAQQIQCRVVGVARDLVMNYGFSLDELRFGLDDLVRRKILGQEGLEKILPHLQEAQLLPSDFEPSVQPAQVNILQEERMSLLEGATEPWVPERIEYLNEYR